MKVLLINDYAVPQGGAEIAILQMRQLLRARGHDARLFASSASDNDAASLADFTSWGTTSRFRTLAQSANPLAAFALRPVLADFQPDVVHVKMFLTQLSPLILPLLRSVPSVLHVVWYRPICPLGTKFRPDSTLCYSPPGAICYRAGCLPLRDWGPLMVQMKLWRRWRYVFDRVIANSDWVKQRLANEGIHCSDVVHNGVKDRPQRAPLAAPPTVVFAGRLVREKGVEILLRAFAITVRAIPAARLIVCGEGPERAALEKMAADLRLSGSVSIIGFQAHPELHEILRRAWVVAIPSRWEEPFGIIAPEAMMSGVAVVGTALGGLTEIVREGETGFQVPPENADALADRLIELLGNPELCERMGRTGREVALAQFTEGRMMDRLLDIYGKAIGHGKKAA